MKDAEGNLYGALDDSGYSSTLTAEIPWTTVEAVAPLPFQGASTVMRTFVAELDENDLGAPFQSKSITVTFACTSIEDSARFGVCGTRCVDFDGVDHCGGCAISCATGQTCRARQCVPAT